MLSAKDNWHNWTRTRDATDSLTNISHNRPLGDVLHRKWRHQYAHRPLVPFYTEISDESSIFKIFVATFQNRPKGAFLTGNDVIIRFNDHGYHLVFNTYIGCQSPAVSRSLVMVKTRNWRYEASHSAATLPSIGLKWPWVQTYRPYLDRLRHYWEFYVYA